ncbi:MAG: creatininase family protein [Planctomycetota bacterium]
MSTRTLRLERMTYEEAEQLLATGPIALLPTGSVEPHGPHLSLRVDTIIAEGVALRAAYKLTGVNTPAVVLPAVPFGVTHYASGFAGVVGLSASLLGLVIQEIAHELKKAGARLLVLVNAHLEPDHLAALADAVAAVERQVGLPAIFPNITRRDHAARLGEEFQSGACHGGSFETSLVLASSEDDVLRARLQGLPPVAISLSKAIRDGKRTFHEAGLASAYCGSPASASVAEGERTYDVLADIIAAAALAALRGG